MGFYLNQFVGELDNTIHLLETSLNPETSVNSLTSYKQAIKSNDPHLFENNFILNKEYKKAFMEKRTTSFSIHIYVSSISHSERTAFGKEITPPEYDGQLATFTEFQPDWSVPKVQG